MKISQIFLLPFAALYSFIIRGWYLYHTRILKKVRYSVPIISVGNLQAGGTGKTPMVAYITERFSEGRELLLLSRGYKRKSFGLKIAQPNTSVEEIGDEAFMLNQKFPHVNIAVAENRITAIPWIIQENESIDLVLLDDGYQQIGLQVNCNILLTPYHRPYTKDAILPIGRLRESASQYKRADIIVITKCPKEVMKSKDEVFQEIGIQLLPHQKGFLSHIEYGQPFSFFDNNVQQEYDKSETIILLTGIADPQPLVEYLRSQVKEVVHLSYPDHHPFSEKDMKGVEQAYLSSKYPRVIISEKDSTRLLQFHTLMSKMKIKFFIQPISIAMDDEVDFLNEIKIKI